MKYLDFSLSPLYDNENIYVAYSMANPSILEYYKGGKGENKRVLGNYNTLKSHLMKQFDCTFVLLPGRIIVHEAQLLMAVERVQRSFDYGYNIMKDKSMECLLYLSGTRQIKRALQKIGIGTNTGKAHPPVNALPSISQDYRNKINERVVELIFGPKEQLKKALEYLNGETSPVKGSHRTPLIDYLEANPPSIERMTDVMDLYRISTEQLQIIINSYSHKERERLLNAGTSNRTPINTSIEKKPDSHMKGENLKVIDEFITRYGYNVVIQAVVDGIRRTMVELSVENFKKN